MKDLKHLLHAEKGITQDNLDLQSLEAIQSIETLKEIKEESATPPHNHKKDSQNIYRSMKAHPIQPTHTQDSLHNQASPHHQEMASLEANALAQSAKNPYKNTINKRTQPLIKQHKPTAPKKKIYVSVGDINGIGLELILRNHALIAEWCAPIYCVDESILNQAASLLHIQAPRNMHLLPLGLEDCTITPGVVAQESGLYSFQSFHQALDQSAKEGAPLLTMPIHKHAWQLAGIEYAGHTQYLRQYFQREAIMMLGCESLFVALYTDHIPLRRVAECVQHEPLLRFLREFYHAYNALFAPYSQNVMHTQGNAQQDSKHTILPHAMSTQALKKHGINAKMVKRLLYDSQNSNATKTSSTLDITPPYKHEKPTQIAVLGLNPHAGDGGILGHEDSIIRECITQINEEIGQEVFVGALAPDSAFIPDNRKRFQVFIAMYHDSGLAPLKALYFDKSINISLNLPILRASPDHGTCFDKAYQHESNISAASYLECVQFLIRHS